VSGYLMPAESAAQDRVFMAFPSEGYSLGDSEEAKHEARSTWAAVAHAIAEFEPVTVVIDPGERDAAKRYLSADLDIVEAPLNDAWMRDIGPTFVHADDGSVAAVDWVFNGWGAQEWARWDRDEKIGAFVAGLAGTPVVSSQLRNEGGGIQVDGEGTVLVTETVQLDPGRNPDATRASVEAELARTIGATHVVWLPRGLTRDSEQYGTRGHVDIVAAITSPGRLLLHTQRDEAHPDFEACKEIREALADTHDADAAAILAEQYPGRKVVTIDARPLFERGGGIHCITQNLPSPRS
jgi:agmatine deiminase